MKLSILLISLLFVSTAARETLFKRSLDVKAVIDDVINDIIPGDDDGTADDDGTGGGGGDGGDDGGDSKSKRALSRGSLFTRKISTKGGDDSSGDDGDDGGSKSKRSLSHVISEQAQMQEPNVVVV